MKKYLGLVLLALGLVVVYACDKALTTEPAQQECAINHTGTLSLTNNSTRGLDYNAVIDGINYGRVAAGTKKTFTLSIGPHLLEIRYADHAGDACSASMPTVLECQDTGLSCNG